MEKFLITKEGYDKMQLEIKDLKLNQRQKIIDDIATARAHGDLKENAEYHAAKEKQAFIESKIKDLEHKSLKSEIVNNSSLEDESIIRFGAYVKIENLNNNKIATYQIVGEYESDIKDNKISIRSPLAKSLIGKSIGDDIEVHIRDEIIDYEIISIKYN